MTQPSYTTDLTDINTGDGTGDTLYEFSAYTGGSPDEPGDTDYFIQGVGCHTAAQKNQTGLQSIAIDYGSGITISAGHCIFMWHVLLAASAVDTFDNGGMRLISGDDLTNYKGWKVGGLNFGRNPYGGFQNVAVDPTYTADYTLGSQSTWQYFGSGVNLTSAIFKGNLHGLDCMRYGRGELKAEYGDGTSGYCTFLEMARANDANDISFVADTTNTDATLTNITDTSELYPGAAISGTGIPATTYIKSITNSTTVEMTNNATVTDTGVDITSKPFNKWGLFQKEGVGFLWKGLISIGTTSNAVDFRDSNRSITVEDTPRTYTAFNKIEINNSGSNVEWTGIAIQAVNPSQLSRGGLEMVANAVFVLIGCTFTDLGTFILDSNADLSTTVFRRCDLITAGAGDFDQCTFDETNDSAKAISCATPAEAALITNCTFNSSGTKHAIEIGGTAANITLTGLVFVGYDTDNPGTAADKAIFVNIASGTMEITISGGSGISQNYHIRTAGATVTVNADVEVTFTGLQDNSEVRVYKVSDDSVVAGIEDATDGSPGARTFAWTAPAATEVYYRIHNFQDGVAIYETIEVESYTVPATNTSIPITQRLDRNVV